MNTISVKDLATRLQAYQNCLLTNTEESIKWAEHHKEIILKMCEPLPHGSGFDNGCTINLLQSNLQKMVFDFEYHHMKDGYYSGWTKHKVFLRPSFFGYQIRITGKNPDSIRGYFYDVFQEIFV